VSVSVVKCRWVKCSEGLQCSDGFRNKVSNVIRRHIHNMKLLLICILLLSHSFIFLGSIFYQCICGCIPV
jgi:hypothetical protein